MSEAEANAGPLQSLLIVGNKIDLEDSREVDRDEVEEFSRRTGIPHIETSAFTEVNVNEAF